MEDVAQDTCFGAGSVAGAVIGTFLTTILLLAVAALLYRQWRRHKGKHLVLVTDPEIVEDAYAFDNPCFKDATPAVGRAIERPLSTVQAETPVKDSARWSTPWTHLGLGSANRNDKRRTLDDSCLGPKATRVSVVSLRSRDFTGLGFNVCGNMREGIFVKDLLHRGPASESGRIHPGDRIASVKISFRNMVYEDALTILSYASPYDVELEVESGGSGSKPTTLLKKSVGPSPSRICHPLYRSQSIPELSQAHKSTAKRLFIADPNESVGSNYSTMNSTLKSSKSTPGSQTLERRHEEVKNNHHKFGIKVLPALDGTVHRIENQNEHNTNLERRHSKKMVEKQLIRNSSLDVNEDRKVCQESVQQRENAQTKRPIVEANSIDVPDNGERTAIEEEPVNIPSEVPAEVHNAAMAARRNRKNSSELLAIQKATTVESTEQDGPKSPQKNKRKAPAPPKTGSTEPEIVVSSASSKKNASHETERDDTIDTIADYTGSLNDYVNKVRETTADQDTRRQRLESQANRRNSESDTDSEVQNSFTKIELNPADITIHRTPVPEANDDEDDEDDVYRKAASLGDLSKYRNKTSTPLERAQSLDMTDTGSKKRKAPLPPEDINESTEDLTKLDQMDTFDRRKLKKSSEWGTLEDVIWGKGDGEEKAKKPRTRKESSGTLERSKSAVEIKLKEEVLRLPASDSQDRDAEPETSVELYNLPLSKRLTQEFIHAERMFNPDEDNSLARIVNDGAVVKSPTLEDVELDFRQAKPLPDENENEDTVSDKEFADDDARSANDDFSRALRYFELHSSKSPTFNESVKLNLTRLDEEKDDKKSINAELYAGKRAIVEETMTKVIVDRGCRACDTTSGLHDHHCERRFNDKDNTHRESLRSANRKYEKEPRESLHSTSDQAAKEPCLSSSRKEPLDQSTPGNLRVHLSKQEQKPREGKVDGLSTFQAHKTKFEQRSEPSIETHFAKRVVNVPSNALAREEDEEDEDEYEFGSGVTVNSKDVESPKNDRHNVSNVSVSSGENSEDSGLVRESMDFNPSESRPPLPSTPVPNASQKMTYITEIKVSPNRETTHEADGENEEIVAIMESNGEPRKLNVTSNGRPNSGKKPPVPPRRSDIAKVAKDEQEKQTVYVSEFKSNAGRNSQISDVNLTGVQQAESAEKKFEHWIFLGDNKEQNRWENGSSQPQTVTNIVLSSGDEKIVHP